MKVKRKAMEAWLDRAKTAVAKTTDSELISQFQQAKEQAELWILYKKTLYSYVSPPPARARHFRATMRYLAR